MGHLKHGDESRSIEFSNFHHLRSKPPLNGVKLEWTPKSLGLQLEGSHPP